MTLKELLKDSITNLPKQEQVAGSPKSFRIFLFEILDEFLVKVKTLDLDAELSTASGYAEKIRVENLIEGIKNSIKCYLDGQPYQVFLQQHVFLKM